MIELTLIFLAGFVGSAHCLGMCGPIVLAIGGAANQSSLAAARTQLAYTAGRMFTYAVLGASAGFLGARAAKVAPAIVNAPAAIAIVAGAALVYQGVKATGWLGNWRRSKRPVGASVCPAAGPWAKLVRPFFLQRGAGGAFVAGMFTGLLPCGLLYGMLALAAARSDIAGGAATMAVFAVGTAPPLVALGLAGRLMGLAARRHLNVIAAVCLIVTGLLSVARGAAYWPTFAKETPTCPFCLATESQEVPER